MTILNNRVLLARRAALNEDLPISVVQGEKAEKAYRQKRFVSADRHKQLLLP